MDSVNRHEWTFTAAISLVVETNKDKIEQYYQSLAQLGKVFMPLDKYPVSERFARVQDRFGASRQLNIR